MKEKQETVFFREAVRDDLPAIVKLLADDTFGSGRERVEAEPAQCYVDAFENICRDANNELVVAQCGERIVGCMQLTYTPYLSYCGSWRATVENVRVAGDERGKGIGTLMLKNAVERAEARGCSIMQLTTDKRRTAAHRFYERIGFRATHEGMKLQLHSANTLNQTGK